MIIIQVKTIFEPIHTAIPENLICPLCGEKGTIEIVIYQKHIQTGFSYKVTKKLSGTAHCTSCNTDIANVQWTPEIEAAFNRLKEQAKIQEPYTKWSIIFKLFLGFIAAFFIFIGGYIYMLSVDGKNKQQFFENPTANHKILVSHTVREDYSKTQDYGNSWAIIRKIDGDTIVIQFHKEKVLLEEVSDSKAPANGYDGVIYKIKKDEFQKEERVTQYHKKNGLGLHYAYIWSFEKE